MEKWTVRFRQLSDGVNRVATWLSILYAFLVTVVVLSSVFLRMAGRAPSWSEEFARWLIVGIAFVSASVALKRGMHIGITAIVRSIRNRWVLTAFVQLTNFMVLIFLGYLFWFGLDAALQAIDQTGDIIPISVFFVKLHIPLGALMMITHLLYYITGVMSCEEPQGFLLSQ